MQPHGALPGLLRQKKKTQLRAFIKVVKGDKTVLIEWGKVDGVIIREGKKYVFLRPTLQFWYNK